MTATVPAAFWLLPCEADAKHLRALIDALASTHGAPTFEPHLTLHVAECPVEADIGEVLGRVADRHAGLALAALATDHSEAYYKALFVNVSRELQDGPGLDALRRDLVDRLPVVGTSYPFHPHVSLLYGELTTQARSALASRHDLQGRTLRFDRIAAVRPATGHRDLARVAHWEVYGHRRLRT